MKKMTNTKWCEMEQIGWEDNDDNRRYIALQCATQTLFRKET